MKAEVEYLYKNNFASPSQSAWSSHCRSVPKADSSVHFCTIARSMQPVTKPDSFPLQCMEDCIDCVEPAKSVMKFDLLKGYWQVPLTPQAFQLLLSLMISCSTRMRNAPSTFQHYEWSWEMYSLLVENNLSCHNTKQNLLQHGDKALNWVLHEEQLYWHQKGGIPKVTGCLEHKRVITQLLREARETKGNLVVLWLDLVNAYGSVPHKVVESALQRHHVPEGIRKLIMDYYNEFHLRVSKGPITSDWCRLEGCIITGCNISVTLFSLAMNMLVKSVEP